MFPLTVRFAATSPPLRGGEEPLQKPWRRTHRTWVPRPHEMGERWPRSGRWGGAAV